MLKIIAEFLRSFAMHFFYRGVATVGRLASSATVVELLGIATVFTVGLVAAAYWIRSPVVPPIWRS
jgi:glycerol uptake facilitator-like aquaporin